MLSKFKNTLFYLSNLQKPRNEKRTLAKRGVEVENLPIHRTTKPTQRLWDNVEFFHRAVYGFYGDFGPSWSIDRHSVMSKGYLPKKSRCVRNCLKHFEWTIIASHARLALMSCVCKESERSERLKWKWAEYNLCLVNRVPEKYLFLFQFWQSDTFRAYYTSTHAEWMMDQRLGVLFSVRDPLYRKDKENIRCFVEKLDQCVSFRSGIGLY